MKKIIFGLLLIGTILQAKQIELISSDNLYNSTVFTYKCDDIDIIENKLKRKFNFVRSEYVKSNKGVVLTEDSDDNISLLPYILITEIEDGVISIVFFDNLYDFKNTVTKTDLVKLED